MLYRLYGLSYSLSQISYVVYLTKIVHICSLNTQNYTLIKHIYFYRHILYQKNHII